jgi:hypothetical protein
MAQRGFFCVAYLDDFIGVEGSEEAAWQAVAALRSILADLGLIEATAKFVAPSRDFVALGVRFSLVDGLLAVTPQRAVSIQLLLQSILSTRTPARKSVESVVGKLLFIAPLFVHGRLRIFPWWRWLATWDAVEVASPTDHIPAEVAASANWWLRQLSGPDATRSYALSTGLQRSLSVISGVQSDSCDLGFGWVCPSIRRYLWGTWSASEVAGLSSNARELATIVLGLVTHGPLFTGHIVVAETDNFTSYCAINNQGADDDVLRLLVYILYWAAELFCFYPVVHWLQGKFNGVTDAISRGELPPDWHPSDLSPQGQGWSASQIPSCLRQLFWSEWDGGLATKPLWHHRVTQLWLRGMTSGTQMVAGICPSSVETGYAGWKATFPLFM